MSNSAEKTESTEIQSKVKDDVKRLARTEKQNSILRGSEKDAQKANKESGNPAARDPHNKYFTRLGIVHRSEVFPQNAPKRLSLHAGPYGHRRSHVHPKNAALGKPRRAATVLSSSTIANTSSSREGHDDPAHSGMDGCTAGLLVVDSNPNSAPSEGDQGAGTVGVDLSTTQSDLGSRTSPGVAAGNGMVRSASHQALWAPSSPQLGARREMPNKNKWLSMNDFPSLLSSNRFGTGLEQIQNETTNVKAGLLVEPGTSMVIVHHTTPRSRTRSSSQPPKSEYKVRTGSRLTATAAVPTSSSPASSIPEEKDYFQITTELDRENLHFSISEALLTAIEKYKSNIMEQEEEMEEFSNGGSPPDPDDTCYSTTTFQSEDGKSREEIARKFLFFLAGHLKEAEDNRPLMNCLQLPLKLVIPLRNDVELLKSLDAACNKQSGDWIPPKAKILLEVFTPPKNFEQALIDQGYRCTGCGMTLDSSHSRYFRFCYYTGKYFCQNCHVSSLCVVPAHILEYWSFKKLPVSNFARDLLTKIYCEPVFKVTSRTCTKIPQLSAARDLRVQLISVKKYLRSCKEISAQSLNRTFDGYIPWTTDILLYSLDDLMMVKTQGTRMKHLRSMLADGIKHIKSCQTCHGNGFVCEFCKSDQDILFPFELEKVTICRDCQGCYHKTCFVSKVCPKCARLQRRRTVLMSKDDANDVEQPSCTINEESCDLQKQPHAITEESCDHQKQPQVITEESCDHHKQPPAVTEDSRDASCDH